MNFLSVRKHGSFSHLVVHRRFLSNSTPANDIQFRYKSSKYWQNKENVNNFIQKLKIYYNLQTTEDWKKLTKKQIELFGNKSLLKIYSVYKIKCLGDPDIKEKYPEIQRKKKPNGYWDNVENVNNLLKIIEKEYNLNTIEEWNNLTQKQIIKMGGKSILSKYSLFELKKLGCNEIKDDNHLIKCKKPSNYWENEENVKEFLLEVKNKYNLENNEDWNNLTKENIISMGGKSLFAKYTIFQLKCMGNPELKQKKYIKQSKNNKKPAGFWNNSLNIQNFIDNLRKEYNLIDVNDWINLSSKQIKDLCGSVLLEKYSIYDIKIMGCPEIKNLPDVKQRRFPKPVGYWENIDNIKSFLEEIKLIHNIKSSSDWTRISKEQIVAHGGTRLFSTYTLNEIIKFIDPSVQFLEKHSKRSSQRFLFLQITKLYPGEEIIEDYFHTIISRESGLAIQFDIFLVNQNIAFEYHGIQHFEDSPFAFAPLEMYKQRDNEKEKLCKKYGIHLVVIPYWWDNSLDSLQKLINTSYVNRRPGF